MPPLLDTVRCVRVCVCAHIWIIDYVYDSICRPPIQSTSSWRNTNEDNCSPIRVQAGTFHLALLGQCSPLVKKCFGCEQLLKIKCDDQFVIPSAPHDLAIVSCMHRSYDQNGERRSRLSNVYFHCNVRCIEMLQPAFFRFLVVIPIEIRPRLLPVHYQLLQSELGIS